MFKLQADQDIRKQWTFCCFLKLLNSVTAKWLEYDSQQ